MLLGFSINIPSGNSLLKTITKNTNLFNCIQVMFDSHNLSEKELKNTKKYLKKFKFVFIHSTYKINIGSDFLINSDKHNQGYFYNSSYEYLLTEIKYAYTIKANGIIIHMGRNVQKRCDNDVIYNNMVIFVIHLFSSKIIKKKFKIIFETSAGQGGEMCYDLINFISFIKTFENYDFYNSIGICIDTCHIFQAGYNLNNIQVIDKIHELFKPLKNKISLIHLNDSYHELGKHIDKHQNIGEGHINTNCLKRFIKPYKNIPMILETPNIFKSIKNLVYN